MGSLNVQCVFTRHLHRILNSKGVTLHDAFLVRNFHLSRRDFVQTHEGTHYGSTIDKDEIEKFNKLANNWWSENGEMKALHAMNQLRVPFIRDTLVPEKSITSSPLKGLRILDAGSGGGFLSEPLARLGATVVGVDASEKNHRVAKLHSSHDSSLEKYLTYINCEIEDLLPKEKGSFHAVVASEILEHVADTETFVRACSDLVMFYFQPDGSLFFTTLNKTNLSYALSIVAAERLLKIVPVGTHDWSKFIDPLDLQDLLDKYDCSTRQVHGMFYNLLTNRWDWIRDTSINYMLHAVKRTPDS
ncbi:ubiquinone biosynthesis O-methyltransferase, mitochondrial isoform X1 [Lingula anatina]|uniref:Ubiquinone biosynthesis O-methyltransferase, mitochondrial n=1 Tax=Lingula anatina TaxID=7574 RepID=A0A1S3II53_LINAN|nr:ubiquinone biosynthesis O-methyltransferase, mitochondrial isoform X1 [Lingula anatina]|eukprot:XP_013397174.1 ubiquinone biosynthesis O-methyltransferase, mitochondrial isoform X1 [Lingula anatina]